jgi:hypothetical protein
MNPRVLEGIITVVYLHIMTFRYVVLIISLTADKCERPNKHPVAFRSDLLQVVLSSGSLNTVLKPCSIPCEVGHAGLNSSSKQTHKKKIELQMQNFHIH